MYYYPKQYKCNTQFMIYIIQIQNVDKQRLISGQQQQQQQQQQVLIIKMNNSYEVNSILKKYEKGINNQAQQSPTFSEPFISKTSRKKQIENNNITFMMNLSQTPLKQVKDNGSENIKTYKNTNLNQKDYIDLWKSFELSRQKIISLQEELKSTNNRHLHELIQFQNRLNTLEIDNHKLKENIALKDSTIKILKEKINTKDYQISQSAKYLSSLTKHYTEKIKTTQQLQIQIQEKLQKQSEKSMKQIINKYEQQTVQLTSELQKFDRILLQKQKEKLVSIEHYKKIQKQQQKQIKQARQYIQEQFQEYSKSLQQLNEEKYKISQNYQNMLRQLKKTNMKDKEDLQSKQITEITKVKDYLKNYQNKIHSSQSQTRCYNHEIQILKKQKKQLEQSHTRITQQLIQYKKHYSDQLRRNTELSEQYHHLQSQLRLQRGNNSQFSVDLSKIKTQLTTILMQNEKLQIQNKQLTENITKLKYQLNSLQNEIQNSKRLQIEKNQQITLVSVNLKKRVGQLQKQRQQLESDLYAERLQSAKFSQQFNQAKLQLKRQYELCLQNIKKANEGKISDERNSRLGYQMSQKEVTYLKMRQLQRKYEQLTCQVVTVQQIVGISEKVKKRHEKNLNQKNKCSIKIPK